MASKAEEAITYAAQVHGQDKKWCYVRSTRSRTSGNPSVFCPPLSLRRGPGPQEAPGADFAAGEIEEQKIHRMGPGYADP